MLIRYEKEKNGKLKKAAVIYTKDEHCIKILDVDKDAVFITGKLRANGYESYIVGGAVRDLLLGKKPKDFDIVTDASPAKIKQVFRNSRIIGKRFRLVHVYFGPRIFEVSTFRSIKGGTTGNIYGTMKEDVMRRDFSCNALFYDPGRQVVVDYVNGIKDIKKRRLRPIIPAKKIFKDDPVRMIRAVKYAAGGLSVSWLLMRRIKKEAPLLSGISHSRMTEELSKIIRSPAAASIVQNLEQAGLYVYLQKEASAFMKRSHSFRAAYLKSLAQADSASVQECRYLAALIRDYLEEKILWQDLKKTITAKSAGEDYKKVFMTARHFILPMNPPRAELDKAVRQIFAEQGIALKKIRFFEKERKPLKKH